MSRYQYEVIDNLESTRTDAALSANQGRILNETKQDADCFDKGIEIGPNNKLNIKADSSYTFSNGKLVYPSQDSLVDPGVLGRPFSAKAGHNLKEQFRTSVEDMSGRALIDKIAADGIKVGDLIYLGKANATGADSDRDKEEFMGALLLVKSIESSSAGYKIYNCNLMSTAFITNEHQRSPYNYDLYAFAVPGEVKMHRSAASGYAIVFELKFAPANSNEIRSYNYTINPTFQGSRFGNSWLIHNYGGLYE